MSRKLQLSIALTPVVHYDNKTDQYVTYFEEFPQAIAVGESEEDADNRLIHLVEVMWKERKEELENTLLTKYINKSHRNSESKLITA
jgi:predicted RNase H-like HicB family nuclease